MFKACSVIIAAGRNGDGERFNSKRAAKVMCAIEFLQNSDEGRDIVERNGNNRLSSPPSPTPSPTPPSPPPPPPPSPSSFLSGSSRMGLVDISERDIDTATTQGGGVSSANRDSLAARASIDRTTGLGGEKEQIGEDTVIRYAKKGDAKFLELLNGVST